MWHRRTRADGNSLCVSNVWITREKKRVTGFMELVKNHWENSVMTTRRLAPYCAPPGQSKLSWLRCVGRPNWETKVFEESAGGGKSKKEETFNVLLYLYIVFTRFNFVSSLSLSPSSISIHKYFSFQGFFPSPFSFILFDSKSGVMTVHAITQNHTHTNS